MSHCVTQVPDLDALLSHVFSDLQQHPDKAEGTGQLLFEMCKGVRNMFHSCAANVSFFSNVGCSAESPDSFHLTQREVLGVMDYFL